MFKPGHKKFGGRKAGVTKGLNELVRAKVPGDRLIAAHMQIAFDPADKVKNALGTKPSIKDRQASMDWLADRGWGKSPVTMDLAGTVTLQWQTE